jgi:hypothetical protein
MVNISEPFSVAKVYVAKWGGHPQEAAVAAGAIPGFGKAEIHAADTRAKLSALLS